MVVGLSGLMASQGYFPGALVNQEKVMSRVVKDSLPFLPGSGVRQEVTGLGSVNLKSDRLGDSWRSSDGLLEHDKLLKINSPVRRPAIIDLHGNLPSSILLSHGISENFTRNEEVGRILSSTSGETQTSGLDLSLPSEIRLQSPNWQSNAFSHYHLGISCNAEEPQPSIIIPNCVLDREKLILDFVGDLARNSEIVIGSDGQVLCMGLQSEMKNMQSIIEEYHLLSQTHLRRKQSVVPYYFRRASKASRSSPTAASSTIVKSPEKVVNKLSSSARSSKKLHKERSPYANSYSYACEILLSLIMNNGRHEKTMLLSLTKSSPELQELLTQFSVGLAGTGLSVLLMVISKMVCYKLPISSSKVLSAGIGFGFLWLSCGVNRLRDTIINIGKSSSKSRFEDESAMRKVDENLNSIFFRAAALMVMVVFKLC